MGTIVATLVVATFAVGAFAGEGGEKTRPSKSPSVIELTRRDDMVRLQVLDKQYEALAMRLFEAELQAMETDLGVDDVTGNDEERARQEKQAALKSRANQKRMVLIRKMMERNREEASHLTERIIHRIELESAAKEGQSTTWWPN
jgi:hypothetical protein